MEILGELVGVHRRRHDQQFQWRQVLQLPQILCSFGDAEKDVRLNGSLVSLVQYHHRVIREYLVGHRFPYHHTVGQVLDPGLRRRHVLESYAVTHQLTGFHPLLLCYSASYAHCGDPSWLRYTHATANTGYSGGEQQLWNLRRLTATGLSDNDQRTVSSYLLQKPVNIAFLSTLYSSYQVERFSKPPVTDVRINAPLE